jgi:hypothetical protein
MANQFDFDQQAPAPSLPKHGSAGFTVIIAGCCLLAVFGLVVLGAVGYEYYSVRAAAVKKNEIALAKELRAKEAEETRAARIEKERQERERKELERIAWKEEQERIDQKYRKIREDIDLVNERAKEAAEREALDRKLRAAEDARRIGSLSRGEYLQAQRALELVKRVGQPGFERLSADVKRHAALIAPQLIEEMERVLGEQRRAKKTN